MPSFVVPPGIGQFKRTDTPEIRLVNLYAEQVPNDETHTILLPRPGLAPSYTVGAGPSRGLFQQPGALNDATFAVSGGELYNGPTLVGALSGVSFVSMAATLVWLIIATGDTLRISNGTTITDPGFPDGAGASCVSVLGGYTIASRTGTRRLYFTLDPSGWDGLDYLSAEQSTGDIIWHVVVSDQLWVFCERTTEVFVLTGDADAPLQSVQGRTLDKGALTGPSVAKADNTVFWVGHDKIVYRASGAPERISQNGIEERIEQSDPADVHAWVYPWFGHIFYVLNVTGGTFVYDAATKLWHEVSTYGRNTANWRAITGTQSGGRILAGDGLDGRIWELRDRLYTDDGVSVQRIFSLLVEQRGYLDTISLDCTTGLVTDPNLDPGVIELRQSRDGGYTFTNWRQKPLGRQGQYRVRPMWTRCGLVDQSEMLVQFRVTDDRLTRISNIAINETGAGRGRAAA
jgi:hypothetical protein